MDWLCMSVPSILGMVSCLIFSLPPAQGLALRSRYFGTVGKSTLGLKRTPGGTSRGGSSGSRDEIRNRLRSYRRSVLREFGGIFDPGSQGMLTTVEPQRCSLQDPDDIQRLLPGRFLSEEDLMHTVPGTKTWVSNSDMASTALQRRLVPPLSASLLDTARLQQEEIQQRQQQQQQQQRHAAFDIKTDGAQFQDTVCNNCMTEIGYEIMEQVVDFMGQSHTVINFKNAFQFIPSGRCVNEHSPCGPSGWQCRQVTRAHWTLVWTAGMGVNLVAHEVPSHCQCLNLGGPAATSHRSAAADTLSDVNPAQVEGNVRVFGWAGLKMDHSNSSSGPTYTTSNRPHPNPTNSDLNPVNPSLHPTSLDPNPVSTDPFAASPGSYSVSPGRNPVSPNPYPYPASSVVSDKSLFPSFKNSNEWGWSLTSMVPSTSSSSSSSSSVTSSPAKNPSTDVAEDYRITFS